MLFGSDVNNTVNTRGIYPEAGGASLGQRGSGLTPYTAGRFNPQADNNSIAGGSVENGNGGNGNGVMGRPFSWWIVLAALLVGLMWAAQRFGSEAAEFKTIKMSVYNVVIISLAAIVGIGAFKVIFGRFRVPGLSDYVAAI